MNLENLISELERAAKDRTDVLEALATIYRDLGQVLVRLGGTATKKKKAKTPGGGVTTGDVTRVVADIRSQTPALAGEELRAQVKQRLKAEGKTLTGVDLRLNKVLGKSSSKDSTNSERARTSSPHRTE